MSVYTPKDLGQGIVQTALTDVISAVSTKTVVKEIWLCNLTSNIVNVEMLRLLAGESSEADKNHYFQNNNLLLQANESKQIVLSIVLEVGQALKMKSNGSNSVVYNISGVEVT